LNPADGIEYIFVNIYRVEVEEAGTEATANLIRFLKGMRGDSDDQRINNKTRHIASFSTILNNSLLGLQVENASVYGSKIEMAFEDGNYKFANLIRKNDIIIIHRIPSSLARFFDIITSVFGINSLPTSISGKVIEQVGDSQLSKLTGIKVYGQKMILQENEPIFSGLITKASLVSHGSTQFRLDAQDMIRILQQINTDDVRTTTYSALPTNTDTYFINDSGKTNARRSTYDSDLLHTLALAVKYHITVTGDAIADPIEIISLDNYILAKITDVNKIYIIPITNSMYLFAVNPIMAARCFATYYTKETGMRNYFNFNIFNQTKDMYKNILKIVEDTHTNSISSQNPMIMFGVKFSNDENTDNRNDDDHDVVNYVTDEDTTIRYVFTEVTMSLLFDYQLSEYIVTRSFSSEDRKVKEVNTDKLVREYFWSLIGGIVGGDLDTSAVFSGGDVFYISEDEEKIRINPKAIDKYIGNINKVIKAFDKSISFSFLFNTRIRNLRSAKYNPLVRDQQTSIPITQVLQLLIGAVNGLPLSQGKSTGGQIDASYDISQRIWLESKIGFTEERDGTDMVSWYLFDTDKARVPTVFINIRYAEVRPFTESNITLLNHIMEYEFYDLPSDGKFVAYTGDGAGAKKPVISYIDMGVDNTEPSYSLGSISNFNFQNIYGQDILERYQSENPFPQVGSEAIKTIPRKAIVVVNNFTRFKDADEEFKSSLELNNVIQFGHDVRKYPEAMYNPSGSILLTPAIFSNSDRTTRVNDILTKANIPENTTLKTLGTVDLGNEPENMFPFEENVSTFITSKSEVAFVTGVRKYYNILSFLPIVTRYLDYIEKGFKGYNGDGDVNVNKYKDDLVVITNLKFDATKPYMEFTDDYSTTVFNLITKLHEFIIQFVNHEDYMIMKYATKVTGMDAKKFVHGSEALTDNFGNVRMQFIADNLSQYNINNERAISTLLGIAGVVFSLSHYMNRMIAQSTIGGVLYVPTAFKQKTIGSSNQFDNLNKAYVQIGDSLQFVSDTDESTVESIKDKLLKFVGKLIGVERKNRLDIFRKPFYVWKVVSYFGGSSTSGTSGSTQRIYVTDSGLQWRTSYEEDNITSRIAESIRLRGLDVATASAY